MTRTRLVSDAPYNDEIGMLTTGTDGSVLALQQLQHCHILLLFPLLQQRRVLPKLLTIASSIRGESKQTESSHERRQASGDDHHPPPFHHLVEW